jgi:cyclopropane fatty-acyl-phospholipid synthase-like methyltransferase
MTSDADLNFTGEFFVPEKSGERIEADHMERYYFACKYARGKNVLDIACGLGYAAPLFIRAGANSYEGVDLKDELIQHAERRYASTHASFYIGDIRTFDNGRKYDLITCFETIEHVRDYKIALANLFVLLVPGGSLFISSPNRPLTSPYARYLTDKPANEFHTQEFTPDELLRELSLVGFVEKNLYGQRQRRVYRSRFIRKIAKIAFGDPDEKASATVTLMRKVPRYFIVHASKD